MSAPIFQSPLGGKVAGDAADAHNAELLRQAEQDRTRSSARRARARRGLLRWLRRGR